MTQRTKTGHNWQMDSKTDKTSAWYEPDSKPHLEFWLIKCFNDIIASANFAPFTSRTLQKTSRTTKTGSGAEVIGVSGEKVRGEGEVGWAKEETGELSSHFKFIWVILAPFICSFEISSTSLGAAYYMRGK